MSSPEQIKKLEKKRSLLFRELLAYSLMIPGAFKEVYRKCGKENCWCCKPDAAGHLLKRITWSENGHSKSKAIPEKDIDWIIEVTRNYREFRKKRRELQRLDISFKQMFDAYEKEIIKKSRLLRDYL
ncbi:MAG: hypothetical protein FVQ80_18685 [Planctomycetes bacterium]|nr:hypothetical protein [Planctomycetota bacterium]